MKKVKEKKIKEKRHGSILPVAFLVAIIVAGVVYVSMLRMEVNILNDYEKVTVYTIASDIAKNTVITEDNTDMYFTTTEVEKSVLPADAIYNLEDIEGKAISFDATLGTILTRSMFYSINDIYSKYNNPKEIGLSMSDISQAVGGIIRTGDYVDVYILTKQNTSSLSSAELDTYRPMKTAPIYSHVYVSKAFDSSGNVIENSDKTSVCQRINVIVGEDEVNTLYKSILDGSIYISKAVDNE